jgi:single-stranded-DNA-specific exonuclease
MKLNRKNKRWVFLEGPPGDTVARLVNGCRISPLLATLLIHRGITSAEEATEYLSPSLSTLKDPTLLKDMDIASNRLADAIERKETIGYATDMDIDGAGSNFVFRSFHAAVSDGKAISIIPNRISHGYGLHIDHLDEMKMQGATLVITGDVGISATDAACHAKEIGLDLIITDHHSVPEHGIPEALAVVNPHRTDCSFPYKYLCGAGVAWFLVAATRKVLRDRGYFKNRPEPDIRKYLDTVSVSTIGDLVALTGENRKLVRYGLDLINKTPSTGLAALIEVSGVTQVTSGTVGFILGPKLNSAGRLDTAHHSLDLLLSDDRGEALGLASMLDGFNKERQEIEQKTISSALEVLGNMVDFDKRKSIVLASADHHVGVVGVASSKLIEMFNKPTILISIDEGKGVAKGSCRSISGFNILDALHACSKHLIGFGGHKAAAGLTIAPENIEIFARDFEFYCEQTLSDEDMIPKLEIDARLTGKEASLALFNELSVLEPFGMDNRKPVFAMERVLVKDQRILKGKHLKLNIEVDGQRFDAIGFGMSDGVDYEIVDLAFTLDENEWREKKTLQLMLKDIRPSGGN